MKRETDFSVLGFKCLLLVLIGVCLVGCKPSEEGGTSNPSVRPKVGGPTSGAPIKIGAVLPLSGDAASWGKNTKNGIDLAVEELNASGGLMGAPIQVVYEDSKAEPKSGVAAINKLISQDKVQAVIDDSVSSVTLAMVPIAEQAKVVILSTGATNPAISHAGEYIFRIWNSDDLEGRYMATHAVNDLGLRTFAIFYINNDYGKGLDAVFKDEVSKSGGNVTFSEGFEAKATDFRAALSKIKGLNPDAIYLVGYPQESGPVLKQIRELGIKSKLLSTVAIEDPQIVKIAAGAADGVIYPFPRGPDQKDPVVAHFRQAYKEKYQGEPGITCDVGYDAARMLAIAAQLGGGFSGPQLQKGLATIAEPLMFHGASGAMSFDANHDVHKPMGFKVIRSGKFIWATS
jgi:branched-chain amino acid transport system substrate-binding protein